MKLKVIEILRKLISIPSYSRAEDETATIIYDFLKSKNMDVERCNNNIWVRNKYFSPDNPTVLLNSHHDTVKPNASYTRDPFEATIENGKLYGLGSNDAGAALVSLLATFVYFYNNKNLKFNLIFAATAEEEISGKNGIELLFPEIAPIDLAIIGEPTSMEMAIAEKGLIVVDCVANGVSGHAARNEGVNAINIAVEDIKWIHSYVFPKLSAHLGPVKMTVTIVNAGTQHNVIPDKCQFTIDIRTTDAYTNEEIIEILKKNLKSDISPRSLRLQPSSIASSHPIVLAGLDLGMKTYASPTLSDQSLLRCTSIKIGPGDSARSHTADEFVYISQIENGIDLYIKLVEKYNENYTL